jgi:hypothetical protein
MRRRRGLLNMPAVQELLLLGAPLPRARRHLPLPCWSTQLWREWLAINGMWWGTLTGVPSCPYRHDAISDLSPWHCKCSSPLSPLPSGGSAVASTTSHPASRLDCGLNLMRLARRVLPPSSVHVHEPSNAGGPRIHGAPCAYGGHPARQTQRSDEAATHCIGNSRHGGARCTASMLDCASAAAATQALWPLASLTPQRPVCCSLARGHDCSTILF